MIRLLGLSRMSLDIARSLYRKLAIQGTVFSQETFRTLKGYLLSDGAWI